MCLVICLIYFVILRSHPRSKRADPRFPDTTLFRSHLRFESDNPMKSVLFLFDPDGREWSDADLIAETTVKWASEWLHYYELWHLTGEWLGPSVGYESVAQMTAAEAESVRAAVADVH